MMCVKNLPAAACNGGARGASKTDATAGYRDACTYVV
jgi:hypothetical protein